MNSLTVIDGGLFTTIQDSGREGYRKFGVPVSGGMDEKAYNLANKIVGNKKGSPVLECTLNGGKYRFNSRAIIAITGAKMSPTLNSDPIEINSLIEIHKDDILELGFAKRGCRTYVAIQGEWDIQKVMGSYSTYTQGVFGGFKGRTLKKGDVVKWVERDVAFNKISISDQIPYYSSKITVQFIPGPEWDSIETVEQERFLNTKFRVSSKSNRMGIRLETDEPIKSEKLDMKSSGVIPGIIQLPPGGNPIILMKDCQTVGGYPRLGKIVDSDLDRLAQVPPNGTVSIIKSEELN